MKKTTQSASIKVRWLDYRSIILLLLSLYLPYLKGNAQTFSYTGAVQTVTLQAGDYEIEMWGADGGKGFQTSQIANEGKGGYSKGTLTVTSPTTYYIYIGGKGADAAGTAVGDVYLGGWNGGGNSGQNNYSTVTQYRAGGGGGGTDIRTTQNTTYANRLIVAGGGGGGIYLATYPGGNGGGTVGGNGANTYNGNGGTQTAGGTANGSTGNIAGTNGALGIGGTGGTASTKSGGGGGGGGYYGGGGGATGNTSSSQGSGGGGSSYIGGVATGLTLMHGTPGFLPNPDITGNGRVIITSLIPCTGTPTAGAASATPRNCASQPFTLSVTGATKAGGITYQWQRSNTGANNFSDITGATSASYTVTNQTVDSDYRFVVTCANGNGTSTSNVVTVTQIPLGNISENFDTTPVGTTSTPSLPICWSFIDNVATTGYLYTYDLASSAPYSGANYVRMYRTNSTTNASQELVMISPETVNLGNGTKQLRFYVKTYGTSATTFDNKLEILSMPSSTSTAGATVLATFVPNHIGYQEYIVPLPAGTNDFFGFRLAYNGTTTTSSISVDDIFYENLETCFHPINIMISNKTDTGANISWSASPMSTGGTGYEYEIRTSGLPGSGTSGLVTSGTTTNLSVTLSTLSPNTEYAIYVRSLCGMVTSRWNFVPELFTTLCAAFGSFSENFDSLATGSSTTPSLPSCWSYIDNVATTGYGYTIASTPQSSPNTFRLYRTNSTTNSTEELVLISPPTANLGNGNKQLRFSVRSYSTTTQINQLEILSMPSNISTAGATVLATISNNGQTWQENTVSLPVTTNDFFGFRLAYNGVTTASSVVIDDIYYEDVPAPAVAATHTDILCNGDATGTATVTVTGGALPLTYLWSPSGGTATTATGLVAGTYTITVTDGLNRTETATVTITEPPAITSGLTSTNITCNGLNNGSITVSPTGGVGPYTYLWNNSATTSSITGLSAGTYSVTITDANGCTLTENVTMTDPAVLAVLSSSHTDVTWYGGNDGSATVSVVGGTAPYTYSWSPSGGTNATATGLIAGNYTVTVTDANGCTVSESFTIIQPIPLMVQSTSQTNVKCNGGSNGTATIVAIGGNAPYTYLWSPSGGTNATATALAAGTYSVLVTDSTGNTITESFTITEPGAIQAILSHSKDVLCNGGNNGTATITVTGGTAPFTYTWSNGISTTNATVSNLVAGNYTVQVTDANGCTASTPVSVAISQPAVLVFTTSNSTNISCYGLNDGSASVAVSGGVAPYSYLWSNGQSGSSLTNLGKGTYVVTVTDANNCMQTQSFTITEPAFVTAPTASSQNFCVGQNATLANIVINGSNIKWYSAATGGNLLPATTALVSGTTYYASQTIGTCESTTRTPVQVTVNQAQALTTTQLNVCSNTRVQNMVVDGFNYTQLRWYNSSTSTIQLPSSTLLATGTYYVSSFVGTCESARQAIQVTVAATVPAPTASFQTVCGGSTLNDLVVVKDPSATLNWYSSMQSIIPLVNTTVVATGTYYVQQVLGNCESSRIAVQVQVINITVPTITSITTCEGTTIADLNTNGTNYVWYTDNSTTTRLPSTYVITSGSYYIANENANCISARKNIAVNVSARPASATGQATQLFTFSAKVSDLVMNEPNVKWFLSAADAAKLMNELSPNTPLTDATTYYGVLVTPNNCGSLVPTAVKVTINLSNAELDLTQLKYYPNPVDSELNISYIEEIKKVEVFTITGQRVFGNDYQGNEVKVDLSRLSAGTYLVKIETAKASQFVKIVKK